MYVSSFLVFLFSRHGAHRDLPSFPTRRSSDLRRAAVRDGTPGALARRRRRAEDAEADPAQSPGRIRARRTAARERWPAGPRSEEHTSELQSQSNLVCRLLLEKKKKTKNKKLKQ